MFIRRRKPVKTCVTLVILIFSSAGVISLFMTSASAVMPRHLVFGLTPSPDALTHKEVLFERKKHIRNVCRKLGHQKTNVLKPRDLEYLFVDDERQTMFCLLPKVASTNWLKVLLILSGLEGYKKPEEIPGREVHGKGRFAKRIPTLNMYKPREILHRLKHYNKVMFVRHPFERLLSAYNNKLSSDNEYFRERFGKKIIQNFGSVTFQEFLKFITLPRTREDSNEHWLQYYRLCKPCEVDYDVIGKQETFNKDVDYVLRMMKVDDVVQFPSRRKAYGTHKTRDQMSSTYRNVSTEVLYDLWYQFKNDFQLFDYKRPNFL